jgi:flagellar M-ring protein FliF
VTREATGTIKRLSAAIVVNHRRTIDDAGKATLTPLTAAELESINALVREAIGFNRERGDSINVVNAPFTEPEVVKEIELSLWQQPENLALARDLGKQLLLLALAMVVILTLIRPALKAMRRPPPSAGSPTLTARIDDPLQLLDPGESPALSIPRANRNEDIVKIARENPTAVANIVRGWVGSQAKGN